MTTILLQNNGKLYCFINGIRFCEGDRIECESTYLDTKMNGVVTIVDDKVYILQNDVCGTQPSSFYNNYGYKYSYIYKETRIGEVVYSSSMFSNVNVNETKSNLKNVRNITSSLLKSENNISIEKKEDKKDIRNIISYYYSRSLSRK